MEEFETKLAKIHIANSRQQASYVYPFAEKAPNGTSELYVVAELPLTASHTEESAEQICLAITSALKRNYRRPADSNTFESATTAINEELAKLAETGQAGWVDKLNCIIGVKDNASFSIATAGKVSAYLFRDYEFTDISCSAPTVHPLKAFDSVAVGKIKLGDVLILSTNQLLNYLAMDRLKDILASHDFLVAIQTIIEILKENAGPEVSFASLFSEQVPVGQAPEEEIELENYTVIPETRETVFPKIIAWTKGLLNFDSVKRTHSANLPKIGTGSALKDAWLKIKKLLSKRPSGKQISTLGKNVGTGMTSAFRYGKQKLDFQNFQNFSKQKKFVFAALCILIIAVATNIALSYHYKKARDAEQKTTKDLSGIETLLQQADSYLLLKNSSGAASALQAAVQKMPQANDVPATQMDDWNKLSNHIADIQNKLEKTARVQVTTLGNLGSGNNLIKLPQYVGTQSGSTIVSYGKDTGKFEDGTLLVSEKVLASIYITGTQSVIYNGGSLFVWDYIKKQLGSGFSQSVPNQQSLIGLKFYATNSRVYTVNKASKQIISFAVTGGNVSKPVIAVNDDRLGTAQDLAIDGSIYVLNHDGIAKYQSGKPVAFQFPTLTTPFSGQGKIATEKSWNNIYVLDAGNNRIIVMDKKGNLVSILKADEFTSLEDFEVDEANKTMYILNEHTLLKINF